MSVSLNLTDAIVNSQDAVLYFFSGDFNNNIINCNTVNQYSLTGTVNINSYTTGTFNVYDNSTNIYPDAITGPNGFQGEIGEQGFQGVVGPQGVQGINGYQGKYGFQGYKGDVGKGFVIFSSVDNFSDLVSLSVSSNNIGEFVLIKGGELFIYNGDNNGNTGPNNSYTHVGDITDESKLIGFQGVQGSYGSNGTQGNQGFQGNIGFGFQGLQGSSGSGSVTTTSDSTNTGRFVAFKSALSGTLQDLTNNNFQYNPSTNRLSAGTFVGNLEGTANNATNASKVMSSLDTANASRFIPFKDQSLLPGNAGDLYNSQLQYNPSTNTLTAGTFNGSLSGNVSGNATTASGITIRSGLTPTSIGTAGQIGYDGNYIYVCVATNQWKRALISSW
jgi:hypothetical protein